MIGPSHSAVQLAAAFGRKNARFVWLAFASLLLLGCEPDLVVGTWECRASDGDEGARSTTEPLAVPWSTSFENAFCDYSAPAGYCYAAERASYEIVTSPVHSGERAAAFGLISDGAFDGLQARCVRRGELPVAAYYSAFFFIPVAPTAANNWNLLHFRSGDAGPMHGIWDVSLERQADGTFQAYVFDHLRQLTRTTDGIPSVPIGAWFQLEVYLRRSANDTGQFALYQDGQLALSLEGLSTDDASYGQWYVGNLAVSLTPAESVLYVDDVSVSLVRR
jgi:hypothetical protein